MQPQSRGRENRYREDKTDYRVKQKLGGFKKLSLFMMFSYSSCYLLGPFKLILTNPRISIGGDKLQR